MTGLSTYLLRGALAGAVGTTALNAATYADMGLRGRPASSTPQQVVERVADLLAVPLPDDDRQREARTTGLGALLGMAAGVSTGLALGALRSAGLRSPKATVAAAWSLAMLVGNGPMTVLGVTDPRKWGAVDWLTDVVPHAAYAVAAAWTLQAFEE